MSVTLITGTTQLTVIGTEHTLYNPTPGVAGVFQFLLDKSPMVDGDVVELRAKQILLTGGSIKTIYLATFYGLQPTDDQLAQSPPISNDLTDNGAVQFSLKQTFGTVHTYTYKVVRIG